jgi:Ca2+/Na+ antiporter
VIYALVALSAISVILNLVMADQMKETFEANNPGMAAPNFTLTSVITFIIFGALFLFLAFQLRKGAGWARIVLTILAVLAVLSSIFTLTQGQPAVLLILSVLSLLLYVALLFFLWRSDSSSYIKST